MDTNFVNEEDIVYEEDLNIEDDEIYITKSMTVKTIIHSLTPVEYPPTSEEGVAIIYQIQGWNNKEAAFTDIQYSMPKDLPRLIQPAL
ncbi:unnamed protein product [Rhizophagus irregularis]|uniref:Uncharacterized protein n=1 Tax=Rhizophagus irregularis TaxID=588596 RepID=A0A2N1MRU9_9GLOM|nr:hypothetical protein RhiirC2_787598 [Rhizophagus irregularis]CAB4379477.1 unnamed protein product [Rhizophagus irregularis]CAB5381688.1 unnamed protein product [Rhizophagus irregularis]